MQTGYMHNVLDMIKKRSSSPGMPGTVEVKDSIPQLANTSVWG